MGTGQPRPPESGVTPLAGVCKPETTPSGLQQSIMT